MPMPKNNKFSHTFDRSKSDTLAPLMQAEGAMALQVTLAACYTPHAACQGPCSGSRRGGVGGDLRTKNRTNCFRLDLTRSSETRGNNGAYEKVYDRFRTKVTQ